MTELEGTGDFCSPECLKILDEADIVVTNPPFSLFREYVRTLTSHKKKFIVLGTLSAIKYWEVFPHLASGHMRLGATSPKRFTVPQEISDRGNIRLRGDALTTTFGNILWFTNLNHDVPPRPLVLTKRYNARDYPQYSNYRAVNVDRVADIPRDYAGLMGVPITFMRSFDPERFQIIMLMDACVKSHYTESMLASVGFRSEIKESKSGLGVVDGRTVYLRILIRNLHPEIPKREDKP